MELIDNNSGYAHALKLKAAAKMKAWNDSVKLVEPFAPVVTTVDKKLFHSDMQRFVENKLRERTKDFESLLSREQLFQFFNFPTHVLREIQSRVKAEPQLTFNNDFTAVNIPDAAIYATTPDELQRLEASKRLIEAVEEIKRYGYTIHAAQLAQSVSFAVTGAGNALQHNTQFIKHSKR